MSNECELVIVSGHDMSLGEVSRAGFRCNRHSKTSPVDLNGSPGLFWPRKRSKTNDFRLTFVAKVSSQQFTHKDPARDYSTSATPSLVPRLLSPAMMSSPILGSRKAYKSYHYSALVNICSG